MAGHFIVCGMGQIGYRVTDLLWRLGEQVVVITLAPRADWLREVQARGVRVLVGDVRDHALLTEADVAGARALIAATDKDLVNLALALAARTLRADLPVVVRLFDPALAQQLESRFDISRA